MRSRLILRSMTLDTILLLLGVFGIILPSLGFPSSIDDALFRIIGIAVVIVGVLLRRRGGVHMQSKNSVVAESRPLPLSVARESTRDDAVM